MSDAVLVFNAGSATVKYALYSESEDELARGNVAVGPGGHAEAIATALRDIEAHAGGTRIVAAGHRVVHGGDAFAFPTVLNSGVISRLESLIPLAPLHQPHNLAGIRAVAANRPDLVQVACFDTAFHQSQPEIARLFALPRKYADEGVKRYGFHGLSYEYVASRLEEYLGGTARHRVIVAHLGNGSSLCAMRHGKSVASTMGFTALEGLMMGTRTGAIDPGVLLYLLQQKGMSAAQVETLLYRESGLLGVSGLSNDMRTLLASQDPRAKLAVDLFVYRAVREIGSLAAALGGLDALVFTAGIGEHAPEVREAIVEGSRWLGHFEVAVIATNEELMIARHALALAGQEASVQ